MRVRVSVSISVTVRARVRVSVKVGVARPVDPWLPLCTEAWPAHVPL